MGFPYNILCVFFCFLNIKWAHLHAHLPFAILPLRIVDLAFHQRKTHCPSQTIFLNNNVSDITIEKGNKAMSTFSKLNYEICL